MFPHGSYLRMTRGGSTDVRSKAHRVKCVDAVDTESTRCHQNTCLKKSLSNTLDGRHVAERGSTDRHRTAATFRDRRQNAIIWFSSRTATIVCDLFDARGAITIGGSPSDGANTSWKNSTIAIRSNRDRAAIAHHSSRNQSTTVRRHFLEHLEHDRRPIVARSWSIVAKIVAFFEANLKQNRGLFVANPEATTTPQGIAPTTPANCLHDRLYRPRFRANFPL